MPTFNGYPVFTPITEHVDTHGQLVSNSDTHRLAQGWLQSMTQVSQILSGKWDSPKSSITASTSPSYQFIGQTPYGVNIVLKWPPTASQTVTLPFGVIGTLVSVDTAGAATYINVNGNTFTQPTTTTNTTMSGMLALA